MFLRAFVACFLLATVVDAESKLMHRCHKRVNEAHTVKVTVAAFDKAKPREVQKHNDDEKLYADLRGSYGKALKHNKDGFVDPEAFKSMVKALETGKNSDFLAVPMGTGPRKMTCPQASLAYSLAGNDPWINCIDAAPPFASAETAAEMVELYWTALVRDVPFNQFQSNPIVARAVAELSGLTDFNGPKQEGKVTGATFLRGVHAGELEGPYINQFWYQSAPYIASRLPILQPVPAADRDFNTSLDDYNIVSRGGLTDKEMRYQDQLHFIRTPRDLAGRVWVASSMDEAMNLLAHLMSFGSKAFDRANPYINNPTQQPYVTFGGADFESTFMAAIYEALKAAWFQKWQVHRRCRPEEFAFATQKQVVNGKKMDVHPQVIKSKALAAIRAKYGTCLLPQAYPEGSPTHPSYPQGHSTFAGAMVTVAKALFNEDFEIPNAVEPNPDNTALVPYDGALTLGHELNKLASNLALGRDHAGVHYRSDGQQGLLLGEAVAIDVLNNMGFLFNEEFDGYTLTKFDGTKVTVGGKRRAQ